MVENLPDPTFRLKLQSGHLVSGQISDKMRKDCIRNWPTDKVAIELTLYDLSRTRIV